MKVVKFNVTEAAIAEMEKEFMKLKISDVNDKQSFDRVHNARMIVKNRRIDVTKTAKMLLEKPKKEIEEIKKAESEIIEKLRPIERHLQGQEDWVKQEKERIIEERLQDRVKKLQGLGAMLDAVRCYVGFETVSLKELKTMKDADFEAIYKDFEAEAENVLKEQQKAEEEARRKAEEDERIRREHEQMKKRLAELEAKQKPKKQPEKKEKASAREMFTVGLVINGERRNVPLNFKFDAKDNISEINFDFNTDQKNVLAGLIEFLNNTYIHFKKAK